MLSSRKEARKVKREPWSKNRTPPFRSCSEAWWTSRPSVRGRKFKRSPPSSASSRNKSSFSDSWLTGHSSGKLEMGCRWSEDSKWECSSLIMRRQFFAEKVMLLFLVSQAFFGRFSATITNLSWQNLEFFRKFHEFFWKTLEFFSKKSLNLFKNGRLFQIAQFRRKTEVWANSCAESIKFSTFLEKYWFELANCWVFERFAWGFFSSKICWRFFFFGQSFLGLESLFF